jgi:glutathione peroxidase
MAIVRIPDERVRALAARASALVDARGVRLSGPAWEHTEQLAWAVRKSDTKLLDSVNTALEKLHEQFRDRGFSVVGFPCNQFGGQEPGTAEEIGEFCSTTYGVTFPMFEKIEVNGPGRHPVYAELTAVPDAGGEAGDVLWNFEKFLVGPEGTLLARFRPQVTPDAPELVAAIEANLPG